MLAGQILGDLGADVIAIEPPAGSAGRRLAPFIQGQPGLERSLTWHALNRNKRGITLDPGTPDGRAILAELIQRADIVIEAVEGEDSLCGLERPANLIVCDVTAFSRSGPKAAYRATDPVLVAAGGSPAMAGPPGRAPIFFPVPQAIMEAGAEAAVASLAALVARDRHGEGQRVDVQGRIATMPATLGRLVSARSGGPHGRRVEPPRVGAMPPIPGIYECRDGHAVVTVAFSPAFVGLTQRIAEWLAEEGFLERDIAALDFMATARAAMTGEGSAAPIERFVAALTTGCKTRTKAEITEASKRYRFMAAPVMTMADVAAFEHYRERGLFASQDVGGRTVEAPARFAQFSNYEIAVRRSAPSLSEHTLEVLSELAGLSPVEVQALFAQGVV
jgi:crotonobetainyl-CoA:carnitine CoA-transferase CaiB-like acyl-CoA transferase